jgi:hypothetical protein
MADIVSRLQSKASQPPPGLSNEGHHDVEVADPHDAWILLDEASDDLVRAEAIVDLLGLEMQASRHQLYAAQIAGEYLRAASERVSEALGIVREIGSPRRGQ